MVNKRDRDKTRGNMKEEKKNVSSVKEGKTLSDSHTTQNYSYEKQRVMLYNSKKH